MAGGSLIRVQPAGRGVRKSKKILSAPVRKQVAKIANRQIHRMNSNKKGLVTFALATQNFTMVYTDLTGIVTGTATTLRDAGAGDTIYAKSLSLRGKFTIGNQNAVIRLIVFQWKPSITIDLPTTGDLLDNDGSVFSPYATIKVESRQKARILVDRTFTVDTLNKPLVNFIINKRLNKKVLYDSGDTAGTTGTGHIFVGIVSSTNTAVLPSVEFYSSLEFEEH